MLCILMTKAEDNDLEEMTAWSVGVGIVLRTG